MPSRVGSDPEVVRLQKDIEAMKEQMRRMADQLPPLDRSFVDLDRSVSVFHAGLRDLPERVAKLEHWRAGEVGDLPTRMGALERWKYETDGALGLTKWAIGGGLLGIVSLVVTIAKSLP